MEIKSMVAMGLVFGRVQLIALVFACIVGCNKDNYNDVFSPESMAAWFQLNHSGLNELLNVIKRGGNISYMQLCGDGNQKNLLKSEKGVISIKNKISFPMINQHCIAINSSLDEDSGEKSLSVTIWIISDGFCLPIKSCEVTRIKYFEEPSYYFDSYFKDQRKVRLSQLADSKWYLVKGDYYN